MKDLQKNQVQSTIVVILLILFSFPNKAIAVSLDSLQQQLILSQKKQDYPSLFEAYYDIGLHYIDQGNYFLALENLLSALINAEKMPTQLSALDCLYHIAKCYKQLNNYQLALDYFSNYKERVNQKAEQSKIGEVLLSMAEIYRAQGNFDMAYDFQLKALDLKELEGDSLGIGLTLYTIGSSFYYQGNYNQALNYYEQALQIGENIPDDKLIFKGKAALGSTYDRLQDFETGMKLNMQSLEMAEDMDYKAGAAYALHNVGSSYFSRGEYRKAIIYLTLSLNAKEESGDKWGQIGSLIALGDSHIKLASFDEAVTNLKKAEQLAQEIESKTRLLDIYKYFSICYEEAGDLNKSNNYLHKYVEIKDAVINEATVHQMGERKSYYEIQRRESQINMLKKENELLAKSEEIRILYLWLAGFGLFLFGCISLLLYRRNIEHKRYNATLELKNNIIKEKNLQIAEKNQQLEQSNTELEQFAYIASHDLKEPLRTIKSYANLLQKRYPQLQEKSAGEFFYFITDATDRMTNLLTELLTYSRVNKRELPLDQCSTSDLLLSVSNSLHNQLKENNAKLIINEKEMPEVLANKTQLGQLFQNLISNAVKFRNGKAPEVEINCTDKEMEFQFSIKDNGIGIAEEFKDKIFEMFQRLHTRTEFEGTGIGLATCKKIVERHGGKIWVESEVGQGSTFYFTLPKNA